MVREFLWAAVALGLGVWGVLMAWRHHRLVRWLAQWDAAARAGSVELPRKWPLKEMRPWLHRIAEQQEALQREASDVHFNLRAILASMEDGVLAVDHEHRITLVNPALLQIFGLKQEPIGETVLSTLRLPILQTMLRGVLEDGTRQQAEVEPPSARREVPVQLVVTAAPLRDAAGLPGALLVFRDVSRLRQLEEIRKDFVANVSHELRTPLSIFHGYLENLIDSPDQDSEEVRASLLIMRKHSLRLNALVEDLLTLARLESNRDQVHFETIDVGLLLRETVHDWEPRALGKGITLAVELPAPLPELEVDVLKFQQVLDNLLDNAMKYTPSGGSVSLQARMSEADAVELTVADTGSGIPREDLPHIFQRFFRADKARSRELGGTGLGLAIVKHIIQAHGGSVRAESELGKGTRIILVLPRQLA